MAYGVPIGALYIRVRCDYEPSSLRGALGMVFVDFMFGMFEIWLDFEWESGRGCVVIGSMQLADALQDVRSSSG